MSHCKASFAVSTSVLWCAVQTTKHLIYGARIPCPRCAFKNCAQDHGQQNWELRAKPISGGSSHAGSLAASPQVSPQPQVEEVLMMTPERRILPQGRQSTGATPAQPASGSGLSYWFGLFHPVIPKVLQTDEQALVLYRWHMDACPYKKWAREFLDFPFWSTICPCSQSHHPLPRWDLRQPGTRQPRTSRTRQEKHQRHL